MYDLHYTGRGEVWARWATKVRSQAVCSPPSVCGLSWLPWQSGQGLARPLAALPLRKLAALRGHKACRITMLSYGVTAMTSHRQGCEWVCDKPSGVHAPAKRWWWHLTPLACVQQDQHVHGPLHGFAAQNFGRPGSTLTARGAAGPWPTAGMFARSSTESAAARTRPHGLNNSVDDWGHVHQICKQTTCHKGVLSSVELSPQKRRCAFLMAHTTCLWHRRISCARKSTLLD